VTAILAEMEIDQELRARASDLVWREIGDEIIILDLKRNSYLSVSSSGRELWLSLTEGTTRSSLESLLASRFGVPGETARKDVDAFLEMLHAKDLLT
jgi:hypothetical protein